MPSSLSLPVGDPSAKSAPLTFVGALGSVKISFSAPTARVRPPCVLTVTPLTANSLALQPPVWLFSSQQPESPTRSIYTSGLTPPSGKPCCCGLDWQLLRSVPTISKPPLMAPSPRSCSRPCLQLPDDIIPSFLRALTGRVTGCRPLGILLNYPSALAQVTFPEGRSLVFQA